MVIAFQSRGFYNYRATVRLFEQAFPDKTLVLVHAGDAAQAARDPSHPRVRLAPPEAYPAVDFVVEGPNVHRHVDGDAACGFVTGERVEAGWLQAIAEPTGVYDDAMWCPHDRAPVARMDTSLASLRAYDEAETTFLWTPYSQFHLLGYGADAFANRTFDEGSSASGDDTSGDGDGASGAEDQAGLGRARRPYLAAYMSSDCKSHRDAFFTALAVAASERGVAGVHALGNCPGDHGMLATHRPPGGAQAPIEQYHEPFAKYRFAIVFESRCEVGYLTEKLGAALLAGAVPVYWGDSEAAQAVFNPDAFIDARRFWRENGLQEGDFAALAAHVLDVDANERGRRRLLLEDALATPASEGGTETAREGRPYPFPSARLSAETEAETRPRVAQAIARLRVQYERGRRGAGGGESRERRNDWRARGDAEANRRDDAEDAPADANDPLVADLLAKIPAVDAPDAPDAVGEAGEGKRE